jgi:ubiquinone/menaquinone biosynthesis C-methylase UbiE
VSLVELNPPGQYEDDRHLRARQRLWQYQVPAFDIAVWVLELAELMPGMRVLDAGCGNGIYLRALRERGVNAVGCDLSPGMLRGIAHQAVVTADVTALPVRDGAFDVVIAAHLLDLVPDRRGAVRELRRRVGGAGRLAWLECACADRIRIHRGGCRRPTRRVLHGGGLRPSRR